MLLFEITEKELLISLYLFLLLGDFRIDKYKNFFFPFIFLIFSELKEYFPVTKVKSYIPSSNNFFSGILVSFFFIFSLIKLSSKIPPKIIKSKV